MRSLRLSAGTVCSALLAGVTALPTVAAGGPFTALPAPSLEGRYTFERLLAERRSIREFGPDSLTLAELAQLLWSAQGITTDDGRRTAPSAGATYPLEVYVVVKRVAGIASGLYHYVPGKQPGEHGLEQMPAVDPVLKLHRAAFDRESVGGGAVAIILVTETARTARRYGERAQRYVVLEAGHAAQNVLLQAHALGLAAVPVGSFDDAEIQHLLDSKAEPLYIISVGRKRR